MATFLLPFREGAGNLDNFSSTGIFLSAIGAAVVTAVQQDPIVVLCIICLILIGGTVAHTRWKVVLLLAAKFDVFILFWMFLMPFVFGSTVIFSLSLPWGTLSAYQEGLSFGVLLGLRMMAMVILFIAALSHIALSEFIGALRTIGVPVMILGSLLIMLRYIPLFIMERHRMQEAQSLRGFERGTKLDRIKSLGYLIGSTIDRAFDRSVRVYEAMVLRGFGHGMVVRGAGFRRADSLLLLVLVSFVCFVLFLAFGVLGGL
jgi:cobalt/nickel transport system permease protein